MKPELLFERHERIGAALKPMRDYLTHIYVEVANSRGSKRQKRAAAALSKALNKIDEARSNLEEVMFSAHSDRADVGVYYGARVDLTKEQFEQAFKK